LIEHFGSVRGIKQAGSDALTAVVNAATAERIRKYFEVEAAEKSVLPVLN
jgi:excinuclease ABC subunit C